jgi:hypothetical protein
MRDETASRADGMAWGIPGSVREGAHCDWGSASGDTRKVCPTGGCTPNPHTIIATTFITIGGVVVIAVLTVMVPSWAVSSTRTVATISYHHQP